MTPYDCEYSPVSGVLVMQMDPNRCPRRAEFVMGRRTGSARLCRLHTRVRMREHDEKFGYMHPTLRPKLRVLPIGPDGAAA